MEPSWKEIIDGCKLRNRQFQLMAYDHVWRVIFPSVYRIIQNRQEAEDVMQESIIKGFDRLDQLSNPEAYTGWQKSISIRMAYNYLRDKKRHELKFPEFQIDYKPADDEVELPAPEALWEVVNSMASGYQMVIKMHLLDGLDHNEIAVIIGVAPSTVRSQYSRALNRIKEIIHAKQKEHV
jgi:RNA polymerase sigma factor (sigma-70 family)